MDPLLAFKRNYLLCPVCKKTWDCLSVHLRRVCMKTHDEDAIEAAVERAKAEMRVLLATGRVFKYGRLCQIVAAADPVSRLIEELESRFLVVTDVPPPLPTTIERSGPSSSRATQATGLEGEPSESSPIGSRRTSESSGETFQCYRDVQWKNPARKLMTEKGLYKKHSIDHALLRHERLTAEAELATHDCTAVLRAAKEDFLAISQKMLSEKEVTTDECLDYMYYLQAPVILKQLQRPGVVCAYDLVGVKEHKTSAQQVATFALSQEEDTWFELYYTCVRPQLQSCIRKRIREVMDGTEERFFYLVPEW
ncbi:hypothetical protein AMELA_G00037350 [Ameiurus melas]|uniref:Uncharacterized protein n=1 Tax=Ameiurus melas TaxID=219545 RepID=A0A7J6BBQ6_AMEME|nr:hypothetical protein AMELA_G00037350 [Ameiurus melas]